MDKHFEEKAQDISSRAVAVSAYLFAEELHDQRRASDLKEFANFFVELPRRSQAQPYFISKIREPGEPSCFRTVSKVHFTGIC